MEFCIDTRVVGPDTVPLVIADIGINHGGSLEVAKEMARHAISAGIEVIKHQTHVIEDEMSEEAKSVIPGNSTKSIFEIMSSCSLSEGDEYELMEFVKGLGGIFISTPFSRKAAYRLESFGVPAYKIGSGECNNYPLVEVIASFGKPIILSTGMNSIESIKPSVEILRKRAIPFALLHCTNVYPTPPELVRLEAINELKKNFPDALVGLSDHTTSNFTCLGAVALGASIVERHFTDDMLREGPDIVCSMDPKAARELVDGANILHKARGGVKGMAQEEVITSEFAFASLVAVKDLKVGDTISAENVWPKRPGGGEFSAADLAGLIGKRMIKKVSGGQRLQKAHVGELDKQ